MKTLEVEMDQIDLEEETVETLDIKACLEMVAPEIKEMFCQTYGADVETVFENDSEKKQQMEYFLQLLTELNPREQKVIVMRLGVFSGNPMSIEDVAKEFGVVKERISQIESKAIRKLYACHKRDKSLKEFLE